MDGFGDPLIKEDDEGASLNIHSLGDPLLKEGDYDRTSFDIHGLGDPLMKENDEGLPLTYIAWEIRY